jgi:hypothetical protein
MNSIKCKSCKLSNFPDDVECRRCGQPLYETNVGKPAKQKAPSSFSIFPWLFLVIAGGIVYYFFFGVQENVGKVNVNEAKRLAEQKNDPTAGLTRKEFEKQRTTAIGNAISTNPSLQAHQSHVDETKKLMESTSNSNSR